MSQEELAILGGEKLREESYPEWPIHDDRDIEAVARVVRSGNWGGHPYPGPETAKFVKSFIELQNGSYGVAMMNGTITMEVALRAAGIGWGDEVIVPSLYLSGHSRRTDGSRRNPCYRRYRPRNILH